MNQPLIPAPDPVPEPVLPSWVFDRETPESPEDAAFSSGAALALLHALLQDPRTDVASGLLRNRLALRCAVQCCKIEGRHVNEGALRDAWLLTLPGDANGPDGEMLGFWRAGIAVELRGAAWQNRLVALCPAEMQQRVAGALAASGGGAGGPVVRATSALTGILAAVPNAEAFALLCADAVLGHALGWQRPVPLLGLHLKRSDLRRAAEGQDMRIAVHAAFARSAREAVRLAHDLARRAHHLRAVAPKLRARGADAAIRLFLSEDAVLPSTMLSPKIRGSAVPMTARSARRLCDRLVDLGAVRELTGRATFRLYGVA